MCWGASISERADHRRRQDSQRLGENRLGLDCGSAEDEIKQRWPIIPAPFHLSRTPLPSRAARGMVNSFHCCNEGTSSNITNRKNKQVSRSAHKSHSATSNTYTALTGFGSFFIQALRYTGYKGTHMDSICVLINWSSLPTHLSTVKRRRTTHVTSLLASDL